MSSTRPRRWLNASRSACSSPLTASSHWGCNGSTRIFAIHRRISLARIVVRPLQRRPGYPGLFYDLERRLLAAALPSGLGGVARHPVLGPILGVEQHALT